MHAGSSESFFLVVELVCTRGPSPNAGGVLVMALEIDTRGNAYIEKKWKKPQSIVCIHSRLQVRPSLVRLIVLHSVHDITK